MQTDFSYVVHTDGGSRGNPGPAAYGYVIYDAQGSIVKEGAAYIGITTNNQAEYQGIVAALEAVADLELQGSILCKLDSQLVVRQINGEYKMKNPDLKPWLEKIRALRARIPAAITFLDIRREANKYADSLVNKSLDAQESYDESNATIT